MIDPNYDETSTITIDHNKLQQILTKQKNLLNTSYEPINNINKKKTTNNNENNNNISKSKRLMNPLFIDLSKQNNKQKDIRDAFKSVPTTSNNVNNETADNDGDTGNENILPSTNSCTSSPTQSAAPIIFADLPIPVRYIL